jgi:hypothetical protein
VEGAYWIRQGYSGGQPDLEIPQAQLIKGAENLPVWRGTHIQAASRRDQRFAAQDGTLSQIATAWFRISGDQCSMKSRMTTNVQARPRSAVAGVRKSLEAAQMRRRSSNEVLLAFYRDHRVQRSLVPLSSAV